MDAVLDAQTQAMHRLVEELGDGNLDKPIREVGTIRSIHKPDAKLFRLDQHARTYAPHCARTYPHVFATCVMRQPTTVTMIREQIYLPPLISLHCLLVRFELACAVEHSDQSIVA